MADKDKIARNFNAFVGGTRNDDGETWTCSCGVVCADDVSLYMHRVHDPKHKEMSGRRRREVTYYVFDDRTGEIVNAVDVTGSLSPEQQKHYLSRYIGADHLFMREESQIPLATLQRYPYWDERP